jgi:hypothetical protein
VCRKLTFIETKFLYFSEENEAPTHDVTFANYFFLLKPKKSFFQTLQHKLLRSVFRKKKYKIISLPQNYADEHLFIVDKTGKNKSK